MKTAFFFQGDFILLPCDITDNLFDRELSLNRLDDFEMTQGAILDQFEIPALDSGGGAGAENSRIGCVVINPHAALPLSWRAVPIRQNLPLLADSTREGRRDTANRLLRAFHITQWRRGSQFCGSCGKRNEDSATELARVCPACGRHEYPRISPAVITIITNDKGQALLAHNKKFNAGVYSLIAGFNEAGESLEETVARETLEEVNIKVSDIRYIISQPWPFPNSLMTGFSARYAGGEIKPDGVEIEDARWWNKEELPNLPGNGSVARYLIGLWLDGAL